MRVPRPIIAAGMAGVVAIAAPFLAKWEDVRTNPYRDIIGVWTVCGGETKVEMRTYTKAECQAMLVDSVAKHSMTIDKYVTAEMPDTRRAALVSFIHNVGEGAFARSTLVKKLNRGDFYGGCNELLKWVYAGGKKLKGLENRRKEERELCLKP